MNLYKDGNDFITKGSDNPSSNCLQKFRVCDSHFSSKIMGGENTNCVMKCIPRSKDDQLLQFLKRHCIVTTKVVENTCHKVDDYKVGGSPLILMDYLNKCYFNPHVDMHALRQMGNNDLKDLGMPMAVAESLSGGSINIDERLLYQLVLEEMKVKKVSLVAGQLWLHSDGRFLPQLIFKRSIVIELISVPKGQRDIFYELRIEYDPQKKKLVVHGWWAYLYDSNMDTNYSRCCVGWTDEEEQEAGRVLDELLEGNPDLRIQMDEIWYSQGKKTNKEFRTHEYLKHGRVEETEDFNEGYYNELMTAVKYSGYEEVKANIIGAYSVGGKCRVSKLQNDLSNEIGVRVKLVLDHETHRKFKGFGILYKDDKMTKIDHPDGRYYKNRRFQVEVVH